MRISEWSSVVCSADFLMMLTEARDGMPTLDELAHILHITSRTLDRRLQREGQQFQEMTKRVRLERAFELLGTQRMSVTQAALPHGKNGSATCRERVSQDV